MEWIEPKIDWSGKKSGNDYVGDYFEYTDYNRIKNNILFLGEYARQLYDVTEQNLGDDKQECDLIYADEVNLIENAIVSLNNDTYKFNYTQKEWSANKHVPTYEDWNRIEYMTKRLYESLVAQKQAQKRLAFTLGGQKGLKV